ncbi:MAG TPA: putative Ig domain-containing protein [Steroidobacteraceae bacterium]|nr:putative Ig domain-containing protein [Steroidobacteraceae bacterium]
MPIAIIALALADCGGSSTGTSRSGSALPSGSSPSDPAPPSAPAALAITTTSLPEGTVGNAYAATLAASGGTSPYKWSLSNGSLPSGLSLSAATGAITGKPSSTTNRLSLGIQVTDSSAQTQTAAATFSLTISASTISIAIAPRQAGLAAGQQLTLTATTNDSAGVSWSVSPAGGSFSPATSASGKTVTFTAPQAPGTYTVTATSVTNQTQSTGISLGVTNLSGIYTQHDDAARDGANEEEYALSPADINGSSFGKLFSCTVDGAVYAQPLWVAGLNVNGAAHNVLFVATEHDSLYAFDADANPCQTLWQVSLIDGSHGGTGGEVTVPSGPGGKVGQGYGDLTPETGITGTPVIDPATDTLYVVNASMNSGGASFFQRLHAINMATGAERPGSPVTIAATVPGTAGGSATVSFNSRTENQRAGLALVNGSVYIAWGSHEDGMPYTGWLIGYAYDGSSFTQTAAFDAAPDAGKGGIWMSGAAPAVDAQGQLYVLTGNGNFDAASGSTPDDDYGDSLLQLSPTLKVTQYFTPSDESADNVYNNDFGAGGAAVLADLPAGSPVTHLALAGGKDGNLYVLNRDAIGGYGDGNAYQEINLGPEGSLSVDNPGVIFSVGAYWNYTYYVAGAGEAMKAYRLDPTTAKLSLAQTASAPSGGFAFPGSTPAVSASGNSNGVVWVLDNSQYCTDASPGCGPAVLHAYDAGKIAQELWNSADSSADAAGNAVKFAVPTIANGKVYVGTRGNNTGGAYGSTSLSGELDVYGLKP